jgi:long-subunit acyl-CoA synthetase (AMP-forming)
MTSSPLPNAWFTDVQAISNHFKAFTNYMTYQTQKYKDNILIRYHSQRGTDITYKTLTYEETGVIATNIACRWNKHTKGLDTVAFLSSHSASYFIVMLALFKLRITMLCISPRNSEVSVVNLLQKTNCKLIIANETYMDLAGDSAKKASGTNVTNDLFRVEHQFPNSYTYLGRRDDIIVMHNGEKNEPYSYGKYHSSFPYCETSYYCWS